MTLLSLLLGIVIGVVLTVTVEAVVVWVYFRVKSNGDF